MSNIWRYDPTWEIESYKTACFLFHFYETHATTPLISYCWHPLHLSIITLLTLQQHSSIVLDTHVSYYCHNDGSWCCSRRKCTNGRTRHQRSLNREGVQTARSLRCRTYVIQLICNVPKNTAAPRTARKEQLVLVGTITTSSSRLKYVCIPLWYVVVQRASTIIYDKSVRVVGAGLAVYSTVASDGRRRDIYRADGDVDEHYYGSKFIVTFPWTAWRVI